ncbi:pickpocket protein 11-like [Contarinia nasturtii]|uniref:pickpocket protein 11-like n=1 Tax=Contarinia nasturtii TaxID=265458 RepID=UPI0012D47176|nr:pickpocket protein 11-like [Contarinia nasturtii]
MNDILNMKRSPKSVLSPMTAVEFTIDVDEVVTSDRSKMFGIEKRKCRFDTETTSDYSYPLGSYTQNLCLMECNVNAALNLCGCRPFFYKIGLGPICNVTEMICLSKNHWSEVKKNCTCHPRCNSIDYRFTRSLLKGDEVLIVENLSVKERRLKRDVKYASYFLIVSVGGSGALFLGCSFISIIEPIYFALKYLYRAYSRRVNQNA